MTPSSPLEKAAEAPQGIADELRGLWAGYDMSSDLAMQLERLADRVERVVPDFLSACAASPPPEAGEAAVLAFAKSDEDNPVWRMHAALSAAFSALQDREGTADG